MSIHGVVSRQLLRRILDTICKTLQDQMISVLSTLMLRTMDLQVS